MSLQKTFDEILTLRAAMWPHKSPNLNITDFDHIVATLAEEVGELRGAVRSHLGRPFSPEKTADREHIIEELGDILVPVLAMMEMCASSPQEAGLAAVNKLTARKERKEAMLRHQEYLERTGQLRNPQQASILRNDQ